MSDPDAPPLDPDALIGALERHQVSFVAVGGLAAQWQGAQRPTQDLDVCPAWDRENLDRVASALRELGARLGGRRLGSPRSAMFSRGAWVCGSEGNVLVTGVGAGGNRRGL